MPAAIVIGRLLAVAVSGSAIFFTAAKDFRSAASIIGDAQSASLSASPAEVPAGVPTMIDITGSGFESCADPDSGDTLARVLWDCADLGDHEPAGNGHIRAAGVGGGASSGRVSMFAPLATANPCKHGRAPARRASDLHWPAAARGHSHHQS